jgi:tmRNA-binding protein
MDKQEKKANEEWTRERQRQMRNGQARDKGKRRMDKPETKANEEWTSQRQRQMKNGQARDKGK